jgi:hypothetical protein
MPRGPRNLRISCDGTGLTQFGGVALLHAFFRRLGIRRQLQHAVRFRQRNNEYSISECIESLLYPLVLGLGRVETTEPLRRNGVFQYLAGLPHYPEATTLRRFLLRLAALGRDKLVTLHDRWRTEMLFRPRRRTSVILDLDTTVLTVYGRQEKSAVGFNPKKRGRRSYQPLLCFEGESADVFAASYHPGDAQPGPVTGPLLEGVFRKLPGAIRQVRVRADAAFYNHEIAEIIERKGAFYVIVARLTHRLKNRLGGLRYRRISSGVSAAEFRYCPDGWKHPARFVVIQRPVPEEPSAQLTLFQMGGHTYQAFVTNLTLSPLNLWRFYNQRATAELIIRELKDAYALGKIPTHDFAANEVFFQTVLLAYNLLNWFKRLCAPPRWQRATLQRLRQRLLVVPAQLVHPAGAPTLRIAPGYVYAEDFLDILKRVKTLAPLSEAEAASNTRRTASKANKRTLRNK